MHTVFRRESEQQQKLNERKAQGQTVMEAKTLEVRDSMTFIPVLAVRLWPNNEEDCYLLSRAGYGRTEADQIGGDYVLLTRLDGGLCYYDPLMWGNRTLGCAHAYIRNFWDELKTGQVIDVEFILGETDTPKESERVSSG
jgi:hypothetical protein